MRKAVFIILTITLMSGPGWGENVKLAQAGMKFLSTSLDARASSMAGAITASEGLSTILFYNPAGLAHMEPNFHAAFGQVQFIADINYLYGSAAYKPLHGELGVFGLTFVTVDYGDLLGTIRAENEQGFIETGTFSPVAYALGFGYSKSLTNQVSIGGNVRFVKQDLVGGVIEFGSDESSQTIDAEADVMVFDFGILYKTGFKSLNFGMSVRNFSQEIEYFEESLQLPLTFTIGFSVNAFDVFPMGSEDHSLNVTFDATHPRDFPEQLGFGLEYSYQDIFSLRAGYQGPNDEYGFSAGVGFRQELSDLNVGIDYGYTPFGIFDEVHRFTVQFSL